MTKTRAENPETIRQWDRIASEEYGLPGIALMENAGAGAARIISRLSREEPEHFPDPFIILCGPGANGGDGYVVARHLFNSGYDVEVYLCFEPGGLDENSDAGVNLAVIEKMGVPTVRPGQDEIRRILRREDPATVIGEQDSAAPSTTLSSPGSRPQRQAAKASSLSISPPGLMEQAAKYSAIAFQRTIRSPSLPRKRGSTRVADLTLPVISTW